LILVVLALWSVSKLTGWDSVGQMGTKDPPRTDIKYFKTAQKLWINYKEFPANNPTALLLFSHGFGYHTRFYQKFLQDLANEGLFVVALDHQGHGNSNGVDHYVQNFDHYVDEFIDLIGKVGKKNLPIYLMGHQTGGLVTLLTARVDPSKYSGVIVVEPPIIPDPIINPTIESIIDWYTDTIPKMPILPWNVQKFKKGSTELEDGNIYVPLRTVQNTVKALRKVYHYVEKITFPLLILQGENDTNVFTPQSSHDLFNRSLTHQKEIKVYPHKTSKEILFESKENIAKTISQWIKTKNQKP